MRYMDLRDLRDQARDLHQALEGQYGQAQAQALVDQAQALMDQAPRYDHVYYDYHMEVIEGLREDPIDIDPWREGLVVLYRESVAVCLMASQIDCWHQGLTMAQVLAIYRPIKNLVHSLVWDQATMRTQIWPLNEVWEALEGATRDQAEDSDLQEDPRPLNEIWESLEGATRDQAEGPGPLLEEHMIDEAPWPDQVEYYQAQAQDLIEDLQGLMDQAQAHIEVIRTALDRLA